MNAILLTGAAARISQEVAMIDLLRHEKGLLIDEDQTYLAGFSSGSLNLLAINACFRKNNPLSWDDYYKGDVLKNLTNDDVYIKTHPVHWDTRPLRKTIGAFLKTMGVRKVSDLVFQSNVLVFCVDKLKTIWVDCKKKKHNNVCLCDLLMSSTAIPVIFPAQRINGIDELPTGLPDSSFKDGGTGGTFKRAKKNMRKFTRKNGAFSELFLISPMREANGQNSIPCMYEAASNEFADMKDFLGNISMGGFIRFLEKLNKANNKKQIAEKIWVSIPELSKNFDILDFTGQIEKYEAVIDWGIKNPGKIAIELATYLEQNGK